MDLIGRCEALCCGESNAASWTSGRLPAGAYFGYRLRLAKMNRTMSVSTPQKPPSSALPRPPDGSALAPKTNNNNAAYRLPPSGKPSDLRPAAAAASWPVRCCAAFLTCSLHLKAGGRVCLAGQSRARRGKARGRGRGRGSVTEPTMPLCPSDICQCCPYNSMRHHTAVQIESNHSCSSDQTGRSLDGMNAITIGREKSVHYRTSDLKAAASASASSSSSRCPGPLPPRICSFQ